MQIYMRVCPICAKENIREKHHSKIYVAGWINWFKNEDHLDGTQICVNHPQQLLVKKSMTCEEFQILRKISNDPSFMEAMNDLKEKDIVEYQLKISQFKSQLGQQESSNVPKCPTCGSTNVSKIAVTKRAVKIGLFGIFGAMDDAGKTYKCNGCGCKF